MLTWLVGQPKSISVYCILRLIDNRCSCACEWIDMIIVLSCLLTRKAFWKGSGHSRIRPAQTMLFAMLCAVVVESLPRLALYVLPSLLKPFNTLTSGVGEGKSGTLNALWQPFTSTKLCEGRHTFAYFPRVDTDGESGR